MTDLSHHHRPRRALSLALIAAAAAISLTFGTATAHAGPGSLEVPTVAVTVTPGVAAKGDDVTLTATVTATTGFPGGTITFSSTGDSIDPIGPIDLHGVDGSPFTSTAQITTSFGVAKTYAIVATFTPTDAEAAVGAFLGADSGANPVPLTITSTIPHPTSTSLDVSPVPIVQGATEKLTATVGSDPGFTPTGTVYFYDGVTTLGSAPLVDGVATYAGVGSFGAGPHEVTASYEGNAHERTSPDDPLFDPSTSKAMSFSVADTSPKETTTYTKLSVSEPTIHLGDTVDLTATITQDGQKIVPVGGVTFYSNSDCSNGVLGTAAVQDDGTATLRNVGSWTVQKYTLCASYVGSTFKTSLGKASLRVLGDVPPGAVATSLAYAGDTSGDYGDPVSVGAVLTSAAGPVTGEPVTLSLGSQACTARTGDDGLAKCTITIDQKPGTYDLTAHFPGDDGYASGDAPDGTFTVSNEESTLSLFAPSHVISGDHVALTATLLEDGTSPVADRTVTLSLGGVSCTAPTGDDGRATCAVVAAGSGAETASASWGGDDYYLAPHDATVPVTVQVHTTLSLLGPPGGDFHDPVTLTAHLADQYGAAVANAPVAFTLGSQSCTSGTTNASGDVTCTLTLNQPTGRHTLLAHYDGDGSALLASDGSAPFAIGREETTLALTALPAALQGSTLTLSATLLEDGSTPVLDGREIAFAYGDQTCTGTTANGVATSCAFTASMVGPVTVSASFAQDDYYATAPADSRQLFVYGATGAGNFVVGDGSATGKVTFWGSQWWKANTLSGGPAPSSFKGYALHATTSCTGPWSTDPGNSTPPPAGPLPSYIAVIVASSASKSGAAISGTGVHLVVVKTVSYDANPGHPGTGAVVARIC